MSIFRDIIDKRAQEAISMSSGIQTGYLLDTGDVIETLLKNPLFLSLNRMSALEGAKVQKDSIKGGLSVSVKSINGTSRTEQVFSNPKFTNLKLVGDGTGKVPVDSSEKGLILADVMFSGSNHQSPTVVGLQQTPRSISDRTQSTEKDVTSNTSLTGTIPTGSIPIGPIPTEPTPSSPSTPSSTPIMRGILGPVLPPLLTPKGAVSSRIDKTQRGYCFNSIRSGTTKITGAELTALATATIAAADWIL